MTNDYSNPVWLASMADILRRQLRRDTDKGRSERLGLIALHFDRQADVLRR